MESSEFKPDEFAGHGNLLILGNGFDLNLGYPTSYYHFVKDNPLEIGKGGFPFVKERSDYYGLGRFLMSQTSIHGWYELENQLAEYGSVGVHHNGDTVEGDRVDYDNLVKSLSLYLKSIDLSRFNRNSVAARILCAFCDSLLPPEIYTFNYTNISYIGYSLGFLSLQATHVHGSLNTGDIIFGVGDYEQLNKSNDYLYKTSNPKYRSTGLIEALDTCDNIVIFGLSLSRVDYPYFEGFLRKVASGAYHGDNRKYIRIITFDNDSRMDILGIFAK